jgi:DNA-binding transcriptional ArsR family regulator
MLSEKNIFKLEKRRKIYEFINNNPGYNIREISRKLNIPFSSLSYHIKYLKKLELIEEKREGKYKKIFISNKVSVLDKKMLGILRNENSCKILLYLFYNFSCSKIELSKELDIPPPTVAYYLKKFIDLEIIEEAPFVNNRIYPFHKGSRYIERKPHKSEKFYRRKNLEVVLSFHKLLIAHKSSLNNKALIDTFLDNYRPLRSEGNHIPKKQPLKKLDDIIDNFVAISYELLRPPFCV